jgi:hypothetical protein
MPNTVPADAEYRSSRCRIPFQQMPNTVPADAEYRSKNAKKQITIIVLQNIAQTP